MVAVAKELLEEREALEEQEDPRQMARRALLGPMELEELAALEAWVELAAMERPELLVLREQIL